MADQPPLSPNPFGTDAPTEDRVGLAVGSVLTAVAASVAWFAVLTFMVAGLRPTAGPAQIDTSAGYVNLFLYGLLGGLAFTAVTAWFLMSPIDSTFRRGGLSIVAAFLGFVVSMGITFLTNEFLGGTALLGVALVALALAVFFGRRIRAAG